MHALHEASRKKVVPDDIEHPHLVLCQVPNLSALLAEFEDFSTNGIRVVLYSDPDHKIPQTAFATQPIYGAGRRAFRHLELMRA